MRDTIIVEKMDQVSGLPKTILHDILSRLPRNDAVNTSFFSKAWRETWHTFPLLTICDTRLSLTRLLRSEEDFSRKCKTFLDYVKKTLLRFHDQGLSIKELKLKLNYLHLKYMSQDMDIWMKLATECRVEVLELAVELHLHDGGREHNKDCEEYILKPGVLDATRSLNKLVLKGKIRVDQAFLSRSIKFFSLRVLSLSSVVLGDEGAINDLISHCPLIEQITLNSCCVYNPLSTGRLPVKAISMHGLRKLKRVEVLGVQEVYIDAPNLENIYYSPFKSLPFKLNFDSCRNLRLLYLWGLESIITEDQWFLELFSKFPLLESLKLGQCSMPERINISSAQLKFLELYLCSNPKEVNIDAPNLLSFRYSGEGGDKPVISILRSSSQVDVNVYLECRDYLDLRNLREFIQSFNPQEALPSMSLSIRLPYEMQDAPNLDLLQVSSPPPSIKHLNLACIEAMCLPLVNCLLSSCCPETISFPAYPFCMKFISIFHDILVDKKQVDCYCSSGHTKCWWHGVSYVEVTHYLSTPVKNDFMTIFGAYKHPYSAIHFKLNL